jgi:hypothetical protein
MKIIHFLFLLSIISSWDCIGQSTSPKKKVDKHIFLTENDTTGKIMEEKKFWDIIEKSRSQSQGSYNKQQEQLVLILTNLDGDDIIKFNNTFSLLMAASYDWKLWGAAYVINQGCSDDGFEYFRHYLIGQGKDRFYSTLDNPESCVDWVQLDDDIIYEGLRYCAAKAYNEKTGKELPYDFKDEYKVKGEPWDEDTVDKKYPKLAKKFGDH